MSKDLYPFIFQRKSVRKFSPIPLDEDFLVEFAQYISSIRPLFSTINVKGEILSPTQIKTVQRIHAPHYLAVTSEEKEHCEENAGFIFQQACLFLQSKGIASCWVGMSKLQKGEETQLPLKGIIAFGTASKGNTRALKNFKRKSLNEIALGFDERLEAARLAPSSMNRQPWFFVCDNKNIYVYKKLGLLESSDLNIGLTLAHLKVASSYFYKPFVYRLQENPPLKKGYQYMGTIYSQ